MTRSSKRKSGPSIRSLVIGCGCAIAAVWIVVGGWIVQLRDLAHDAAGRELSALSMLLADHTDRTLQGVDLLLSLLAGRLEAAISAPSSRDSATLHGILRGGLAGIPQVTRALVLAADGRSVGDSEFAAPRAFDGSDRLHFQIHAQRADVGLFISDPVRSRVTGQVSIFLSRRLNAQDGSFAGIIAATLDPAYFAAVFASAGRTAASHATLLKISGIVLATTLPDSSTLIGQQLRDPRSGSSVALTLVSGIDSLTEIRGLTAIANATTYPVVVVTSRSQALVEDSVKDSAWMVIGAGVVVSILIIVLGWIAARQMRSLDERFRDGIERMSDGFALWDPEERLIAWNSRYESIFPELAPLLRRGLAFEEAARWTLSRMRPELSPSEIDALVVARQQSFRNPGQPWESLRPDSVIEIEESRTDAGGIVTICRDMTAHKAHEAALERALIAEREATLLHRRFVAMASHEFRTPLAVIDGAAQRALAHATEATPDLVTRMGRIRDAVRRMGMLIDRTLSSARLEEGKLSLEPQRFDLGALLTEVIDRQRQISAAFGFTLLHPDAPVMIDGDPRLLEQVFTNLLSNAVKYSGRARRIEVALSAPDGPVPEVEVTVRDHGVGVPSDEVGKLFGRFFRARTAAGISGTGLGLHVTRELVQLHGGRIEVGSQLDQGSTFTVHLPREMARLPPPHDPERPGRDRYDNLINAPLKSPMPVSGELRG